jgi:hypothetical protein
MLDGGDNVALGGKVSGKGAVHETEVRKGQTIRASLKEDRRYMGRRTESSPRRERRLRPATSYRAKEE